MPPTSPSNSPQQSHQLGESSPEFHDQPSDLHDDGKVSVLSNQGALLDSADPACPRPPSPLDSSAQIGPQGWKRLICSPLTTQERISLVADILSNRGEVEMARRLRGDDAQTFVNVIYEACSHVLQSPESKLADFDSNFRISCLVDQTLDDLDQVSRTRCFRLLCKICGCHGLLPKSLAISVSYDRMDDPLCHGGFAEVWKGTYRGLDVAVKVLKSYQRSDQERVRSVRCRQSSPSAICVNGQATGVLQGGRGVERTSPSERVAAAGSDHDRHSIRDGVGVDG